MEYCLTIGGIGFHIISDYEIGIEESFTSFLFPNLSKWDVTVEILQEFEQAPKPVGDRNGKDLLLEYYYQEGGLLCLAMEGWKGALAVTHCNPSFSHLTCYMNTSDFAQKKSLGNILRLIPMRMILQHYGVLFFHGSQIALGDTGILFTAPSGTGKTTQARLWRDHRGARIICNDRTLVRGGRTYGFPVDGSEPVCSGEIHWLGAVVLLSQSKENSVRRMNAASAMAKLMPQIVIDTWDTKSRERAMEQLMELIQDCPVYLLSCRPDIDAVDCLERQLTADGVIK